MSEEQEIESIEEYLKEISDIRSQWLTPVLAFRGQGDEKWPLASSAERRLKASSETQDKVSKRIFLEYHKDLLKRCKLKNYDQRGRKPLNELELLADLQHHGAATCLLDFTRNALVALWFACEKGESESDGKVFVVNTAELRVSVVKPEDIAGKSICDILEFKTRKKEPHKQEFWCWEPAPLNERIPVQHSLFLFGPTSVEKLERKELIVKSGSKEQIRRELRELYDIHEESLFPDFVGFAYTQRHNAPYALSPEEYFRRGRRAAQRGEYREAIEFFTKAIELDPKNALAYALRAVASIGLDNKYEQAIQDFTTAIELDPKNALVYAFRGRTYLDLGKHEQAVQDFTTAIELDPNHADAYHERGHAHLHLGKLDKAKSDLTTARKLGANIITLNRGQITNLERQLRRTLPADITEMLTKRQ